MMNFLRKQMKWVMAVIVIAFLLSTFFMYEGRSTRRTPERNADGSMSDYEVAQINGRSLMRSELERRLRDYLSNYSSRNAESLDMPAIYQAVLDDAILESQLAKEVEESGIRISDAEADMAMKNRADIYYPTRETFYNELARAGIKVEDYKRGLARQMALDQLISRAIGEVNISEDKAVEFYDTMKNLIYSRPEGFRVHAANFRTSEQAEVLRGKLLGGESWDVIVSNDELASNDLINITHEPVFLPATALQTGAFSVLASLDVGEISPVFEVTSFDFAVGLKTEHVDATVTPYDEVSADIRTLLTQQEQRNRLTAWQESLRNKAQVTINDESLFARNAVTSPDETIPELAVDDIPEVTSDAKTESGKESKDANVPAIVIEEIEEEDEPASDEVKAEPAEVKAEEAKADEPVKEEAKPETPAEAKTEETKADEPVKEEAKPEIPAEAKTDEPAKDEVKPETPAEVKADEAKSEAPAEVKSDEAKTDEPAPVAESESKPVQEEVKAVTEASNDVKGAAPQF